MESGGNNKTYYENYALENRIGIEGGEELSEDENKQRGNWSGRFDFLLSCLGYAVGLGNVWRFPYLCFKNGGAVFLIPYAIMLFLVGMPIFVLELTLGQFTSSGPLTCWKFAPIFSGIGGCMVVASTLVGIYYNIIIGYSLYFLFASFTDVLPWSTCGEWSSDLCLTKVPDMNCSAPFDDYQNGTCYNGSVLLGLWNVTAANEAGIKRKSPSNEYFYKKVLELSSGIEDLGELKWQLCLCLLLAWIIVFFCLFKGIKSSGKVVYFTAIFPYVVLVILLIRGVLLEGHRTGVDFYIAQANFTKLQEPQVWIDATTQIFFSLSAAFGGLIALSSYNRFHNHCLRDAIIVSLGNCLTSFFAGFVVFSYVGFMAHRQGTTVEEVAAGGPGLAFIVYPEAVAQIPVSPLWSILFFIMLLTLGLDSQFTLLETLYTSILDIFPAIRPKKTYLLLVICVILFCLGLPMCTKGGLYMLDLVDNAVNAWPITVIGLFELIAVAYVYGAHPRQYIFPLRLLKDLGVMLQTKMPFLWPWWASCWVLFSPALIMFVMIFQWINHKPYWTVEWAERLKYVIQATIVSPLIIGPIVYYTHVAIVRSTKGKRNDDYNMFSPKEDWGPALLKHRRLVTYDPLFEVDPWSKDERSLAFKDSKASHSNGDHVRDYIS